jgi:hypothetical protein
MKKLAYLLTLIVFFQIVSCDIAEDMDTTIDLGMNYRYVDDLPNGIIYHPTKKYQGVGREIVPPFITNYSFNDRYIIAKTKGYLNNNKPIEYWIIDKEMKGEAVSPLDSMNFYNKLDELNITLLFVKENEIIHPRMK